MQPVGRSAKRPVPFLVLALAIGLGACAPPAETPSDVAADRQAVTAAHNELIDAYQNADTTAFLLMLDKTDDVLIHHPRLQDSWQGLEEIQRNLPGMFDGMGKSTWRDVDLAVVVEDDVAWLTSKVLIGAPQMTAPFTGRGTEVWVRRMGGWRLAHGHWSANPEF